MMLIVMSDKIGFVFDCVCSSATLMLWLQYTSLVHHCRLGSVLPMPGCTSFCPLWRDRDSAPHSSAVFESRSPSSTLPCFFSVSSFSGYCVRSSHCARFFMSLPANTIHEGVMSSGLSVRLFVRSDIVTTISHERLEQFW